MLLGYQSTISLDSNNCLRKTDQETIYLSKLQIPPDRPKLWVEKIEVEQYGF